MIRAKLFFNDTHQLVYDDGYRERGRKRPQDFTRNRKMSFEELIFYVLKSAKSSTSTSLRRFFKEMGKTGNMTQQSLSEARAKLTIAAFEILFREVTAKKMVAQFGKETWGGYHVYAIDGTKIALPADRKLLRHFGAAGRGATSPTAQGSVLYDVLNDIVVDASIDKMSVDERTQAINHIDTAKPYIPHDRKIIIFDRGYPSAELISHLAANGFSYLMRVRRKFNAGIDAQTVSDGAVTLSHNGVDMKVRVLKFELDSGEVETLITDLDDEALTVKDFKELYFMRWPIETKYDLVKNKLQLENFTIRSVEGIQQDFFAAMYLTNIMKALEDDIMEELESSRQEKDRKYEYKVNKNELIGVLKDNLIMALSYSSHRKQKQALEEIFRHAQGNLIPIREGRSVERNKNTRNVKYHHNQKSNA